MIFFVDSISFIVVDCIQLNIVLLHRAVVRVVRITTKTGQQLQSKNEIMRWLFVSVKRQVQVVAVFLLFETKGDIYHDENSHF